MTPVEMARRALTDHLAALPTRDLLARYVGRRDPEAFAGLVYQLGPMVLGVCHRVLGRTPDTDDAFQAVFVALARQAGTFRDPAALPGWLHRVALRTARKALARRRDEPDAGADRSEPVDPGDPYAEVAWREVRRVLDAELDALPERYRGPVVLCWLDGLTQQEAATRLGVSLNTLKRRLTSGRELLRSRLVRRGLAPVLIASAVLDPTGLRAAVPDPLATLAVGHSLPRAVGHRVESLVVSATNPTRRAVLAALLGAGAAAAGGIVYALTPPRRPPETPPEQPVAAAPEPRLKPDPLRFERIGPAMQPRGAVRSLLFTRDGTALISGGGRAIQSWNLATGEPNLLLDEEFLDVLKVAVGPDGKTLLALSDPGQYRLLDTAHGSVRSVDYERGTEIGQTATFALTTDGNTLAMANGPLVYLVNASKLWNSPEGTRLLLKESDLFDTLRLPEGYSADFHSAPLLVSPDGRSMITPHSDGSFLLWDVKTRREKAILTTSGKANHVVGAFSPDGRYLVRGGADLSGVELKVWDLVAGTERVLFSGPWGGGGMISALAFHPDSRTLLSAQRETITQWDSATGENRGTVFHQGIAVSALALSPDGTVLASAGAGLRKPPRYEPSSPSEIQLWKVSRTR